MVRVSGNIIAFLWCKNWCWESEIKIVICDKNFADKMREATYWRKMRHRKGFRPTRSSLFIYLMFLSSSVLVVWLPRIRPLLFAYNMVDSVVKMHSYMKGIAHNPLWSETRLICPNPIGLYFVLISNLVRLWSENEDTLHTYQLFISVFIM